jgi:SPP1 family predicted phage head-tail adaptor
MIDPGKLKTRLLIQMPVEMPDGQGGVARSYATLATVWAAVTPLRAAQRAGIDADAEGAAARYRIVLRSNFSLTLQHRLVEGGRIYRIAAINESMDRRFIEIDAELRVE